MGHQVGNEKLCFEDRLKSNQHEKVSFRTENGKAILCPISNSTDPLSQQSQIITLMPGVELNLCLASLEVNKSKGWAAV